mgnify:CR=1 FL=1
MNIMGIVAVLLMKISMALQVAVAIIANVLITFSAQALIVAVVAGTSFLMNSQSTDNRSDMNDATLPEVMVKIGSTQANKMYGYRQQMQTDFMRGSITPLDTTKKVVF